MFFENFKLHSSICGCASCCRINSLETRASDREFNTRSMWSCVLRGMVQKLRRYLLFLRDSLLRQLQFPTAMLAVRRVPHCDPHRRRPPRANRESIRDPRKISKPCCSVAPHLSRCCGEWMVCDFVLCAARQVRLASRSKGNDDSRPFPGVRRGEFQTPDQSQAGKRKSLCSENIWFFAAARHSLCTLHYMSVSCVWS